MPVPDSDTVGGRYDIATFQLEAGADPLRYAASSDQKLLHFLVADSELPRSEKHQQQYRTLLQQVVDAAESIEQAAADVERRMHEYRTLPIAEIDRRRKAEVAERVRREDQDDLPGDDGMTRSR